MSLVISVQVFSESQTAHLIIAGGYDERVLENVEHFAELKHLVTTHGLNDHVTFLRSITDAQKHSLLHACNVLLYTPDREHFGIVPIEAMYMERPVIAVASGGPMETVEHGKTGFLCQPIPEMFAKAMLSLMRDPKLMNAFGEAGKKRVKEKFSFESFTEKLDTVVKSLTTN